MRAPVAAAAALVAAALGCGGASTPPVGGASSSVAAAPAPARVLQLNAPGALVRVEDHVAAGYVTVVDFWAAHCAPCGPMTAQLEAGTAAEPRILIRKVDVGDGLTPVAQAYEIGALPHMRIYDRHRRLRHILVGSDCGEAAALAKQLVAEP